MFNIMPMNKTHRIDFRSKTDYKRKHFILLSTFDVICMQSCCGSLSVLNTSFYRPQKYAPDPLQSDAPIKASAFSGFEGNQKL